MKPAIIVVDMLKDSFNEAHSGIVARAAREIAPKVNTLTEFARNRSLPVIFSMDSFLRGDFIFQGKMIEHSIRGTEGAEVADELTQCDTDIYIPKRRFSAFFKTDLDQTLRLYGVDTVVLAGLMTQWCVLASAMDALAHDFHTYIMEDCCASYKKEVHESVLTFCRQNPLYPLFQVMTAEDFMQKVG